MVNRSFLAVGLNFLLLLRGCTSYELSLRYNPHRPDMNLQDLPRSSEMGLVAARRNHLPTSKRLGRPAGVVPRLLGRSAGVVPGFQKQLDDDDLAYTPSPQESVEGAGAPRKGEKPSFGGPAAVAGFVFFLLGASLVGRRIRRVLARRRMDEVQKAMNEKGQFEFVTTSRV